MKKKILFLILISLFLLTGCFGKEKNKYDALRKKVEKTKSYALTGELIIANNDDSYAYKVSVSYMSDNYFKVSLKNKTNNHEQIILKNFSHRCVFR